MKSTNYFLVATAIFAISFAYVPEQKRIRKSTNKYKRPKDRNCNQDNLPLTAVDTTKRLADLRNEIRSKSYKAYLVPSSDAHLSEYIAPKDDRLQWISGFSGSAGTAVVTEDKAALWTDGRYFEQAENQLDCNWQLMKIGESGVPSIEEWLIDEITFGGLIGANSFLFAINEWQYYEAELSPSSLIMSEAIPDLIDLVWEDRPVEIENKIFEHPLEYAGYPYETKLSKIRKELKNKPADYLLMTKLDEIAWIFNLRGGDIPYTPVFTAYAVIGKSSNSQLFVNQSKFEDGLLESINPQGCELRSSCIEIKPYDDARSYLESLSRDKKIVWMARDSTSYGMYNAVNTTLQVSDDSPVALAKSVKNSVQNKGMRNAHIADAVALCEYIKWLEENVPLETVDEISGAEKLKEFRLNQSESQGLSFASISASGPNAAIIHYGATPATNRNLSINELYLIDSGGQYFGGTTDVTRTLHFGEPSFHEKEMFTRALMGLIDAETAVFPVGTVGDELDILVRMPLWKIEKDFNHGTGHGVGQFLSVHEYPPGIGVGGSYAKYGSTPLNPGMYTSLEPGYYESGHFGIRHENIAVVEKSITFLKLRPVTLVPFQAKMIDANLLSNDQLNYLNNYHWTVLFYVGEEIKNQNKTELYYWLGNATAKIYREGTLASSSVSLKLNSISLFCFLTLFYNFL